MKKMCKVCGKEYEAVNSLQTCSPECREILSLKRNRENVHRYTMMMKDKFFEHYGSECAMCGEKSKDVLTIDHINDNGAEHRKKVGDSTYNVVLDLERRGWPENEVQTLCYNCNNKKKIQKQTFNGESYMSVLRDKAVESLGAKCACCGESDKQKLELRPKNGNIKYYKEKYSSRNTMLAFIVDVASVRDEFEVLCVNCHRRIQYKRD